MGQQDISGLLGLGEEEVDEDEVHHIKGNVDNVVLPANSCESDRVYPLVLLSDVSIRQHS